jgi:hypothetical protein
VALRASRFVCAAIPLITRTTSVISPDEVSSLATIALVVSATVTALVATVDAVAALAAISWMAETISSEPRETSSTLSDTWRAACDASLARVDVVAAAAVICPLSVSSPSAEPDSRSAVAPICPTLPRRSARN